MQPDDARRADARAWLAKSGTDLRGMAIDLPAEPPLLEDALFHSQVEPPLATEVEEAVALAREAHAAVLVAMGERLL